MNCVVTCHCSCQKHASLYVKQWHVQRTTADVNHQNITSRRLLMQTVRQRCRCRLINDPQNIETCNQFSSATVMRSLGQTDICTCSHNQRTPLTYTHATSSIRCSCAVVSSLGLLYHCITDRFFLVITKITILLATAEALIDWLSRV